MKSSKAKISPTKSNVADISYRTVLAIEFNKQNFLQDIKNWNESFLLLDPIMDRIEKVTKKELGLKSQELNKEFLNAKNKLVKLTKDMENAQERLNKTQVKFETKLSEPFSKGKFNSQETRVLEEAKTNITKIQEILLSTKQLIDPMIEKGLAYTKRLSLLEDAVHKLCLCDEVEEAEKINDKLNKRIEAICEETSHFLENPNSEPYDSTKVTQTFLQLFENHQKGEQLLFQLQKNLHITKEPQRSEQKRSPSPTLTNK